MTATYWVLSIVLVYCISGTGMITWISWRDNNNDPPLVLAFLVWPVVLVVMCLIVCCNVVDSKLDKYQKYILHVKNSRKQAQLPKAQSIETNKGGDG